MRFSFDFAFSEGSVTGDSDSRDDLVTVVEALASKARGEHALILAPSGRSKATDDIRSAWIEVTF